MESNLKYVLHIGVLSKYLKDFVEILRLLNYIKILKSNIKRKKLLDLILQEPLTGISQIPQYMNIN